jgi:hypothetical protein
MNSFTSSATRRAFGFAAAGSLLALTFLLVLNGAGVIGGGPATTIRAPSQEGDFISQPFDGLCPGEREAPDVETLASWSTGLVWMPDAADASKDRLTAAALCSGAPTLFFDSGVSVAFEPDWFLADPEQRWTDMAKQWGTGEVITVLGQPAYIAPGAAPGPDGRPISQLLVVLDGTLIRIHGPGVPVSHLIDVANSMQPGKPVQARSSAQQ